MLDRIGSYTTELNGSTETILEIGPGTGALTDRLLAVAERVRAIERDPDLAAFLREEFSAAIDEDRLQIIHGDALSVALPEFDAVVSNLPYGVASELIFRLLPAERPMLLMVQREFADRLTAEPGTSDYGRATVTAGYYADIELLEVVPPDAFAPSPPVESALIRLTPTERPPVGDEDRFFDLVTAVFTQRRKTLRNAIRNTTHISGIDDPDAVLDAIPDAWPDRRPAMFAPEEYASLARTVHAFASEEA